MWPWRKENKRDASQELPFYDPLFEAFLTSLTQPDKVTRAQALDIPSVSTCVEIIGGTVAMLPVKLYREDGTDITEVKDDIRVKLLNDETGDLLDSFQMKKAWVTDYLLDGNGYIYINRYRNAVASLHYVESRRVTSILGTNPIFKTASLSVNGASYREFEFLKIARRTKDGIRGFGIVEESQAVLAAAYNALLYENYLVKTGGNKKGFLKAKSKLEANALEMLKRSFQKMYSNNAESVIVLNDGIEFQEASNTSVEMQLNENKKTNAVEICKLFQMAPSIVDGTAKEDEYALAAKVCFNPILTAIESALNRDLLLESEKKLLYFSFDRNELLKGDIVKRFTAYKMAVESNIMQVDEVRYKEDLPQLGMDFVRLGLNDVLYDPKKKTIYTPNTDKAFQMGKGEVLNEDSDPVG